VLSPVLLLTSIPARMLVFALMAVPLDHEWMSVQPPELVPTRYSLPWPVPLETCIPARTPVVVFISAPR